MEIICQQKKIIRYINDLEISSDASHEKTFDRDVFLALLILNKNKKIGNGSFKSIM